MLAVVGLTVAAGVVVAEAAMEIAMIGSSALRVSRGSSLSLDGDSTLHRYKADARQMKVAMQVADDAGPGQSAEALVKAGAVKSITVTVPVTQLKSGEGGLDDNMVKALKGSANPEITYRIEKYEVLADTADGFGLRMSGKLKIAGAEKAVTVDAKAVRSGNALRVVGSKDLLMSEFGVQPPVLMMGMIKVKDLVTVKFDLQLQPGQ